MKIVVFSKNIDELKDKLSNEHFYYEDSLNNLKKTIGMFDGLIAFGLPKDVDLAKLKWIHSLGAGVDWIINNKTLNPKCKITRIEEGFGQPMFEYSLSRILAFYQHIEKHRLNKEKQIWSSLEPTSIVGKKVLIVGTGKIGNDLARRFSNLGMIVYGVNTTGTNYPNFINCFDYYNNKEIMKFDVIISILPSTKLTDKLLNKNFFDIYICDIFINIGRGNTLDTKEIVKRVEAKEIKIVYLDVFEEEPLKQSSNLWNNKKIIITPHIAGITTIEYMVKSINDNCKLIVSNDRCESLLNIKKGY
ncbi:MAG: NAD(P)-dependent oxidoreductase [Candidatus Izemoplasma sp.]